MNSIDAKVLALDLMREDGLHIDWKFEFDNAKRRFGCCHRTAKLITLSKVLTEMNNESVIRDTILHEIAHAKSPERGHGREWKKTCIRVGTEPRRCYDKNEVKIPSPEWQGFCPNCLRTFNRYKRRIGSWCAKCGREKGIIKWVRV